MRPMRSTSFSSSSIANNSGFASRSIRDSPEEKNGLDPKTPNDSEVSDVAFRKYLLFIFIEGARMLQSDGEVEKNSVYVVINGWSKIINVNDPIKRFRNAF